MWFDLNFQRRDLREYDAIIYYLLIHVIKDDDELDYWHLNWLLNSANYEYFKKHFCWILPIQYLCLLDYKEITISSFNCDWTAHYKKTKNELIKKTPYNILSRNDALTHESYLSPSLKKCLNHAILKYKIYGKFLLILNDFIYSIKSKIFKIK